ncbi:MULTISPECIES: type II toxin-antitoxin system PemK/MazF family toxin [unclassified Phenylobacterium]|uniref:type II toxin-antitoxin system PemK/MazF family toxin n=1 Tax=unclassified Phenylobacterium TaxID=2640670 RepID=UPI00083ADB8C|nr:MULTISPECIES: type II toxin-antitoxin system PemK/MazF family toxin [unclassified Phenylobacterium]
MAYPKPEPGLVIRYSFLWREQADRGQDEGEKDRPCAIIMTTEADQGDTVVIVLPVTHTPPAIPDLAVEIPATTKARLGLDDQPSWIIVNEANRFIWPGPDLRPRVPGDTASVAYGLLPAGLYTQVRDKLAKAIELRLARPVKRT